MALSFGKQKNPPRTRAAATAATVLLPLMHWDGGKDWRKDAVLAPPAVAALATAKSQDATTTTATSKKLAGRTTRRERALHEQAIRFGGLSINEAPTAAALFQTKTTSAPRKIVREVTQKTEKKEKSDKSDKSDKSERTDKIGERAGSRRARKFAAHSSTSAIADSSTAMVARVGEGCDKIRTFSEYVRVSDDLFKVAHYLHSPVKAGTPSFPIDKVTGAALLPPKDAAPAYQGALERMLQAAPQMEAGDGIRVGTNWFPLAVYFAELEKEKAAEASGETDLADKKGRQGPMVKVAERWARQAAVNAEEVRLKQFTLYISDISAAGVRDSDASSGSDPYAAFTLLGSEVGNGEPATDTTPPIRNSRNPTWHSTCLRFDMPAGSQTALSAARLQCGDALWNSTVS